MTEQAPPDVPFPMHLAHLITPRSAPPVRPPASPAAGGIEVLTVSHAARTQRRYSGAEGTFETYALLRLPDGEVVSVAACAARDGRTLFTHLTFDTFKSRDLEGACATALAARLKIPGQTVFSGPFRSRARIADGSVFSMTLAYPAAGAIEPGSALFAGIGLVRTSSHDAVVAALFQIAGGPFLRAAAAEDKPFADQALAKRIASALSSHLKPKPSS
jgi:hypothetical protein